MRPTTSLESFLRRPVDAYVVRRSFAFWQHGRDANGLVVWGAPDAQDVREMTRAFDVVLGPHVDKHVSLVDTRAIEHIEPLAFSSLVAFMVGRREAYATRTVRQAVLCEKTAFGAAIIGLYHLIAPAYATRIFHDEDEAFAWLRPGAADLTRGAYRDVRSRVLGDTPLLSSVRAALAGGEVASLADLSRSLRTSVRTLQRNLGDANTSFRAELARAHVEHARPLLRDTRLSIGQVAERVGFATASSFTAAFGRVTGETPSRFRERTRGR